MAVVVCGVVWLLAVAAVASARNRFGIGGSVREAVVAASAVCGGFVAAVTEGLGAVGLLKYDLVLVCWCGFGAILTASLLWNRHHLSGWCKPPMPLGRVEVLLLTLLAIVVGAAGVLAAACPPNNYDVVLYHLPRQMQWLQQAGVAHFPTQDYRLTVNPPFAEFVGLHLMLLAGTDQLYTVESWAAMVLTLGAVSLVARELGLTRKGQLLAALFAATVPVGFHEAANGKNDWLVAFWLASAVFWVLRVWKAERVGLVDAVFAGLAVGLLVLTKGTGGVYAVPVVLLGGLGLVVRRPRGWVPAAVVVAALAVLPNVPHWSRNLAAYGSVSGETFGLGNERQAPAVWVSGVVRNVGMHLASPRYAWNRKVDKYVHRVHGWLGLGTEDPRTTWLGVPFTIDYRPHNDDFATAPVHAIVLLVALPVLIGAARRDRAWLVYLLAAAGGFLLFCAAFKWQPWHPRLHLPCLALGGVAAGKLLTRPGLYWLTLIAVAGLVLSVVPAATRSEARSLGPNGLNVLASTPDRLRFFNQDAILNDAREIVSRVNVINPAAVDLINHEPAPWEYPITLWLRAGEHPPRVSYFYPVNGSPDGGPPADVVIDVSSPNPPDLIRHPRTRAVYRVKDRVGRFTLYRPVPPDTPVAGQTFDHPVARFGIGVEHPGTH